MLVEVLESVGNANCLEPRYSSWLKLLQVEQSNEGTACYVRWEGGVEI